MRKILKTGLPGQKQGNDNQSSFLFCGSTSVEFQLNTGILCFEAVIKHAQNWGAFVPP